jgi:hypothetical protein
LNLDEIQFKISKVEIDAEGKDRIVPVDTGSKDKEKQPPPTVSEKTVSKDKEKIPPPSDSEKTVSDTEKNT